jgi:hypothetical protein
VWPLVRVVLYEGDYCSQHRLEGVKQNEGNKYHVMTTGSEIALWESFQSDTRQWNYTTSIHSLNYANKNIKYTSYTLLYSN